MEKSSDKQTPKMSFGFHTVLLLANALPFLHLIAISFCLFILDRSFGVRLAAAISTLLLAPPILNRLLFIFLGKPRGTHPMQSKQFLIWWLSYHLQGAFNRITFLEELLRMIPGLYSFWLRLWGSKIGKLTFWAPGARVFDRCYLDIGDFVVVGLGCRFCAHEINLDPETGVTTFIADPIHVGDYAMLGGYTVLMPGVKVADRSTTRRGRIASPYTEIGGHA